MPGSIRALRRQADPIRGRGRIPLTKRRAPGAPQYRRTGVDTLSSEEDAIAVAVEDAFNTVSRETLLDAVERRDVDGYARSVLAAFSEASAAIEAALLRGFVSSGEATAREIGVELSRAYRRVGKADTPSPSQVALQFRFNAVDPRATEWARAEAGRLITNMTASQREMMRGLIEQSFVESRTMGTTASSIFRQLQTVTPGPTAREFADAIGTNLNGLTARYERAVMNRVADLGDDLAKRGVSGTRALEQMRKTGDKYATKLRRARSRTIARTERMTAHNQARLLSYQQAIDSGLMSKDHSRKIWSTGPFDVCPICVSMSGTEAKVGDPFTLPNGSQVQAPPAHPNCRCTLQSRTDTTLYDPPQALGTGVPGDPFRIGGRGLSTEGQIFSTSPLPGIPAPPPVTPPPPQPTNNATLDEVVRIGERQRRAGAANGLSDAADDAIRRYENGSGDYSLVNWRLRDADRFETLSTKADKRAAQEVLDGLDEAMERAPDLDQPITLYRGVTDEGADALAGLRVGDTFEDAGFVSTSFRRQTAEAFARPRRTGGAGRLIEIEAGPGTRGLMPRAYRAEDIREALTGRYDEAEFLLNRGTRFEVVEASDDVLRARVVTEPTPPAPSAQPRTLVGEVFDDAGMDKERAAAFYRDAIDTPALSDDNRLFIDWYTGSGSSKVNGVLRGKPNISDDPLFRGGNGHEKRAKVSEWLRRESGEADDLFEETGNMVRYTRNSDQTTGDFVRAHMGKFDDAVNATVNENVTVFRGMRGMSLDLEPGDVMRDEGFMSTSLRRDVAERFAKKGTLLRINVKAGQRVMNVGGKWESELVLPRGSSLRVVNVDRSGKQVIVDAVLEG